jgi:hypothetical protein
MAKLGDINSQTDQPFVQSGFVTATTNASGDVSGTFPTPFTAVPILQGAVSGQPTLMSATVIAITASTFSFRCFGASGTALASTSVTVTWIAVGVKP